MKALPPGLTTVSGFCGTCHHTPDVGNHSVKLPINIGVANGGANNNNPGLDIADLPVFALPCVQARMPAKPTPSRIRAAR
jgi:hypothetical protein